MQKATCRTFPGLRSRGANSQPDTTGAGPKPSIPSTGKLTDRWSDIVAPACRPDRPDEAWRLKRNQPFDKRFEFLRSLAEIERGEGDHRHPGLCQGRHLGGGGGEVA